jgi:hypothetical protein
MKNEEGSMKREEKVGRSLPSMRDIVAGYVFISGNERHAFRNAPDSSRQRVITVKEPKGGVSVQQMPTHLPIVLEVLKRRIEIVRHPDLSLEAAESTSFRFFGRKSEDNRPHRHFRGHVNNQPAAGGYFDGLFYGHGSSIRRNREVCKNEEGRMKNEEQGAISKEQGGMKKEEGAGFSGSAFIFHFSLFIFHLFVFLSCASPTGEEGVGGKSGGTGGALEKTVIDGKGVLELTTYMLAPVTGGTPVRSFVASTFAGIVNWTEEGQAAPGVFRAGASYTAAATLFPLPSYTFGELEGDIADNHDGTVTVTIVFAK